MTCTFVMFLGAGYSESGPAFCGAGYKVLPCPSYCSISTSALASSSGAGEHCDGSEPGSWARGEEGTC